MSGVEEPDEAVFIACIQELDELVDRKLRRYPLAAVVVAIGTCLAGMLGALLDESQCTRDDIRELLREIESEIFPPQGSGRNRLPETRTGNARLGCAS